MRNKKSSDRISCLPDESLAYILSFLPTLSAVQTSILSSRWRRLFTLTRNLSFDDAKYFRTESKDQCEEKKLSFERFVYGVLALHISPIHEFSLQIGRIVQYDCSHPLVWITTAIQKGVQHLDLYICFISNAFPSCMFNCRTLTVLKIHTLGCDLSVPALVCLPSLITLELRRVRFPDADSANRLLVGCPHIKELTLDFCRLSTDSVRVSATALQSLSIFFCPGCVVIDAPKLANLSYLAYRRKADINVKNPRSLLRLEMSIHQIGTSELPQTLHDIVRDAHNVRELVLRSYAVKVVDNQIRACSKLVTLRLADCYRDTWKYLMVWLSNSPQLETVIFEEGLIKMCRNDFGLCPDIALPPFSSNVKIIRVQEFRGHKLELLLLKYLLENARVLQRLILVIRRNYMNMERELQVSKELLLFPKASSYCRIELKEI